MLLDSGDAAVPPTDETDVKSRFRSACPSGGDDTSSRSLISIFVGTWNLQGAQVSKLDDLGEWLLADCSLSSSAAPDVFAIGLQEVVSVNPARCLLKAVTDGFGLAGPGYELEEQLLRCLQRRGPYVSVQRVEMVGLYLVCFVKKHLERYVCRVDADRVRLNAEGIAGKKGAVAIRLCIRDTSLCFINVHLPSGQFHAAERSATLQQIMAEVFQGRNISGGPRLPKHGFKRESSYVPKQHAGSFVFGDFNFRLNIEPADFPENLAVADQEIWKALMTFDEFGMGRESAVLKPFKEGRISFPPTYKYVVGVDALDESRVAAWTDRVLQVDSSAQLFRYSSHRVLCHTSDHRPVSALFRVELESHGCDSDILVCAMGCGRQRFRGYETCCTHCNGPEGPHAADCSLKAGVQGRGRQPTGSIT